MSTNSAFEALKVGVFAPTMIEVKELAAGEVGFIIAGIKDVADAKVGDTVTLLHRQCVQALDGFKEVKPMMKIYEKYLGKPLSEKAHHLLHTHYFKRETK